MSKILAGVFVGVFVGALLYELVDRANPELVAKIKDKLFKRLDDFLDTEEGRAASR